MDLGKLGKLQMERQCVECGEKFKTDPDSIKDGLTAMQKHADHSKIHQYTPAQWTDAYRKIQEGKSKK